MKQVKKQKEKDNYRKFSFLFPVILTAIDAVMMLAFVYVVANQAHIANMELARLIAQAGTVLLALSPTGLMVAALVSYRHMKKHPDGSAFYTKAPMIFSIVVWGIQVLYMATLTGA